MNLAVQVQLREIGLQLDAGTYPRVFNDGIVALSDPGVDVSTLGAENCNGKQGKSRPAAGSRKGSAGGSWTADRSWSPGEAEPSGGGLLRENYRGQLGAVFEHYPRTAYWLCSEGMWLSVESAVLAEIGRASCRER